MLAWIYNIVFMSFHSFLQEFTWILPQNSLWMPRLCLPLGKEPSALSSTTPQGSRTTPRSPTKETVPMTYSTPQWRKVWWYIFPVACSLKSVPIVDTRHTLEMGFNDLHFNSWRQVKQWIFQSSIKSDAELALLSTKYWNSDTCNQYMY